MRILNHTIEEALPTSLAKKFSLKQWKPNMKMFDRLTPFFGGETVYRKVYPVQKAEFGDSILSVKKSIEFCLKTVGYTVNNWSKTTCVSCDLRSKPILIGKVLETEFPPNSGIKQLFTKNEAALRSNNIDQPVQQTTDSNVIGIVSRHPYDIAGMSTGREWTSCMILHKDGKESKGQQYIPSDIIEGTLVAYMVHKDDLNITKPLSRLLITPYNDSHNNILYGVRQKFYGLQNQKFFWEATKKIAEEINNTLHLNISQIDRSQFSLNANLYQDDPSTMLDTNTRPNPFESIRIPLGTTELPKLEQIVVTGTYNCSNLLIRSLKNSPKIVGENFYCYNCEELTDLKGGPVIVKGIFDCSESPKLISLKGAPKKIGEEFSCDNCAIESLEYSPDEVNGLFSCDGNKLKNLKGSPKKIGGTFSCARNNLTSLEGSPQIIGRHFNCSENTNLTSLDGAPKIVDGDFFIHDCGRQFTEKEVRAVCQVGGRVLI